MESFRRQSRRPFRKNAYVWDSIFTSRQQQSYASDQRRIERQPGESIVHAFLRWERFGLDPPLYNFAALRNFLDKAKEADLLQQLAGPPYTPEIALIDDRCDRTGWRDTLDRHHAARDWNLYARYPPSGECQQSSLLTAKGLFQKLAENRQSTGAERRTVYIADMTPLCGLAIAANAPVSQVPVFRDFMQRYVSNRSFISVQKPFHGFTLEFHLPYYALRRHALPQKDSRDLRGCTQFTDARSNGGESEFLYQAQISVLVTGIDEWFWTAYCCIDTYFGSDVSVQAHHESEHDALIGGNQRARWYPVWNPREYFLRVLSSRFRQVTREWDVVVSTLEGRLQIHEAGIFIGKTARAPLIDDADLSRTREYRWITEVLRVLHNTLIRFIESWEIFEDGELQYFYGEEQQILRNIWDNHVGEVEKDINELRCFRTRLQQKIDLFDNMRSSLVDASTMAESRVATDQGKNIGLLTRVTVAYLPLSLGTAVFSMVILPKDTSWSSYAFVIVGLIVLTYAITHQSRNIKTLAIQVSSAPLIAHRTISFPYHFVEHSAQTLRTDIMTTIATSDLSRKQFWTIFTVALCFLLASDTPSLWIFAFTQNQ